MKLSFGRALSVFFFLFLTLFLIRFAYGHWSQPNGEEIPAFGGYATPSADFVLSKRNIAGQKSGVGSGPGAVDQRYEKIASMGINTEQFEQDETRVRTLATEVDALIQHEQSFGLEGQRQLQLALGVNPDRFDDVIGQLRGIGKLVSFQSNKADKTNEYRELLAQRSSLEKSRDNLVALKSRDAQLRDLMGLEAQILDLEKQIQALGVSVGEFDSEFEFVTIKLTMSEVPAPRTRFIGFPQRAFVALRWAIGMQLAVCLAFAAFAAGFAMVAWGRAKWSARTA